MKEDPLADTEQLEQAEPEEAPVEESAPTVQSHSFGPIQELRLLVYGLALFLLLTSFSLNLFIYKQNRKMQMELDLARQQANAIESNQVFQQNRAAIENLLREIANQSPAHPEATQILGRYNIRVQTQGAAPGPGIPAPAAGQ